MQDAVAGLAGSTTQKRRRKAKPRRDNGRTHGMHLAMAIGDRMGRFWEDLMHAYIVRYELLPALACVLIFLGFFSIACRKAFSRY